MGMKTFLDVLTLCAYKQTSDRFTEPKRVRSTVKLLITQKLQTTTLCF